MCGSPPKPKAVKEKPPQYLRNPWLDGLALGGVGAARAGRNALRVDLAAPGKAPSYLGIPSPVAPPVSPTGAFPAPYIAPSLALGGGGGRSRAAVRSY
jgi:hypothetical protein